MATNTFYNSLARFSIPFMAILLLLMPIAHADQESSSHWTQQAPLLEPLHDSIDHGISKDDDISKKSRHANPKLLGVPPGMHFIPMLAMFAVIFMIVFENTAEQRQMLVLPLVLSFFLPI